MLIYHLRLITLKMKNILQQEMIFLCFKILKNSNLEKYEWVLFLNDSILFPIHGIEEMYKIIKEKRKKSDFWGLYLSKEREIR